MAVENTNEITVRVKGDLKSFYKTIEDFHKFCYNNSVYPYEF